MEPISKLKGRVVVCDNCLLDIRTEVIRIESPRGDVCSPECLANWMILSESLRKAQRVKAKMVADLSMMAYVARRDPLPEVKDKQAKQIKLRSREITPTPKHIGGIILPYTKHEGNIGYVEVWK